MARKRKESGCGTILGILILLGVIAALSRIIGVILVFSSIVGAIYLFKNKPTFRGFSNLQKASIVAILISVFIIGFILALPSEEADTTTNTPSTQIAEQVTEDREVLQKQDKSETQNTSIPTSSTSSAEQEPQKEASESSLSLEKAEVIRVIDGDTIEVRLENGAEEKVRFIGVDTPESTTQHEPYGEEASSFTKEQLDGNEIYLEKDVSETDKYGRLLRYIWLEPPKEITKDEIRTKMFNAILLIGGYAQVATYPPDVKYVDYFTEFQIEAREANAGLWALDSTNASYSSSNSTSTHSINENSSVSTTSSSRIVYWTPKGKSYHYSKNCPTLSRSKTILEGPLSECPKSDPCDRCTY